MSEQEKKIKDKDLEKVAGGKAYWEGSVVRFSSEEGDWHADDKFRRKSPYFTGESEYIVLQDNGTFSNNEIGHRYNAKRYDTNWNLLDDITITDYEIMMREYDIEFIGR